MLFWISIWNADNNNEGNELTFQMHHSQICHSRKPSNLWQWQSQQSYSFLAVSTDASTCHRFRKGQSGPRRCTHTIYRSLHHAWLRSQFRCLHSMAHSIFQIDCTQLTRELYQRWLAWRWRFYHVGRTHCSKWQCRNRTWICWGSISNSWSSSW